jgi:hypothetical protein
MRLIRSKLTFANVVALLALFIALGGSAYAIHLGKNAVKSRNIKNGAVTEAKLAEGAVDATKLSPGAVGAGSIGAIVLRTATVPLPDGSGPITVAHCKPGEMLLGGTGRVNASGSSDVAVEGIVPSNPDGSAVVDGESLRPGSGLYAQFHNFPGSTGGSFGSVSAFCLE